MNETNFTIYEWASSIIDIPEHKTKEVTHDFGIWFSFIKEETSQELAAKELIKLTNLNKRTKCQNCLDLILFKLEYNKIPKDKVSEVLDMYSLCYNQLKEERSKVPVEERLPGSISYKRFSEKNKDYTKDLDEFQRHSLFSFLNNLYAVNDVFK